MANYQNLNSVDGPLVALDTLGPLNIQTVPWFSVTPLLSPPRSTRQETQISHLRNVVV